MNDRQEQARPEVREAMLLLMRVAADSGKRHDLDDVINRLGFDRAELEDELDADEGMVSLKPVEDDDFVQLVVHPALRPSLWEWLESRGLRVGRIPIDDDDLPSFAVSPASMRPELGGKT